MHPVLSGNAVERIQNSSIERLVVTDSMPTKGKEFDKLEVLSVASLFAKAVRRIHEGDSVSELFS